MEQNWETEWAHSQELVVLPFPIEEEKLSPDDETNSQPPQQEKSSKYANESLNRYHQCFPF